MVNYMSIATKWKKAIYTFLMIVNSFVMVVTLVYTINYIGGTNKNRKILGDYREIADLKYEVHLKQNDYIDESVMEMGKNYITDYVDFIRFQYQYHCENQIKNNYHGNYQLVAILRASYKNSVNEDENPEILTKEYVLDEGEFIVESGEKKVELDNDISLVQYEKIVSDFKGATEFPLTTTLELIYKVNIDGKDQVRSTYQTTVEIPLLRDVFAINVSGIEEQDHKFYQQTEEISYIQVIVMMTIIVILAVIDIILLSKLFTRELSEEEKEIQTYLKKYDDYIVNTKTAPNLEDIEVIDITDFTELLTMSVNSNSPIFYYENPKIAIFYVKDESVYIYSIYK